jgi:hypothetical protein
VTDLFRGAVRLLRQDHPTEPSRIDYGEPEVFYTDKHGTRWYFYNTAREFERARNALIGGIFFFALSFYFNWTWLFWLTLVVSLYSVLKYLEYREPYSRVCQEFRNRIHDRTEMMKRTQAEPDVETQRPHGSVVDDGVI